MIDMEYNKLAKVKFSENLKSFRKAAGFTQQQFADALGMQRSTYAYYETGKSEPNIENTILIARLFSVTVDELFNFDASTLREEKLPFNNPPITERVRGLSDEEKALILSYRHLDDNKRKKLLGEAEKLKLEK